MVQVFCTVNPVYYLHISIHFHRIYGNIVDQYSSQATSKINKEEKVTTMDFVSVFITYMHLTNYTIARVPKSSPGELSTLQLFDVILLQHTWNRWISCYHASAELNDKHEGIQPFKSRLDSGTPVLHLSLNLHTQVPVTASTMADCNVKLSCYRAWYGFLMCMLQVSVFVIQHH